MLFCHNLWAPLNICCVYFSTSCILFSLTSFDFSFWYTQKFSSSILVQVSSLNGISPLFYIFTILQTWLLIIDNFHYCLCKQSESLLYCLLFLIFYNCDLNYFYFVRIYINASWFHLCSHILFSHRSIFKHIKCLPSGPSVPHLLRFSHYSLPSTLNCSSITSLTLCLVMI